MITTSHGCPAGHPGGGTEPPRGRPAQPRGLATFRSIADDVERVAATDRALLDLAAGHQVGDGDHLVMEWEYLLLTARRRHG